jgi:hypothetical protein
MEKSKESIVEDLKNMLSRDFNIKDSNVTFKTS